MKARPNWRTGLGVGLHYDFHANAEDREIGAMTVEDLVETWRRVKPDWVQCDTKGSAGYASYPSAVGPHPEVMPGDALRIYREASRRLGLRLVSHYCALYDKVASRRPEWARIDQHGNNYGHLCVNRGYQDEQMIPQLLEVIDGYDIDGFWLDSDAWRAAPCYCETCRNLYSEQTGAVSVPLSESDPGWLDWLAFHRRCYQRHVKTVADAVHARKPDCLVTVNWAYTLLQPDDVTLPVDTLSGDVAHNHTLDWQEPEVRFLDGRGLPWDLQMWAFTYHEGGADLELRSRDHLCQAGAITLASGGAAAYYIQPLRTGMPVAWEHEVMAEVLDFCHRRAPHCIGTTSVPQAAVLHSVESHYAGGFEPLAVSPEIGLHTSFRRTAAVKGAALALLDLHLHVDVVTETALESRAGEYALIVVPEPRALSSSTLAALAGYVRGGGRLLLTGTDVTELAPDLTGLMPGGAVEPAARWIELDGRATGIPGPWRQAEPSSAETVRPQLLVQEPSAGRTEFPAISLNRLGAGRVATIPSPIFANLYSNRLEWRRKAIALALESLAPDTAFCAKAPASVHVTLRERGDTLYLHLVNTAADPPPSPRKLDVERVPEVGPIEIELQLERPPTRVHLEPEGDVDHRWDSGRLVLTVPRLHIHSIVVLERA